MSAQPMAVPALPVPPFGRDATRNFQAQLADLLAEYLAAADLVGRLHVLQRVKRKTGAELPLRLPPAPAAGFTEVLGFERVPPTGAIERLLRLTGMTRAAFDALSARYRLQAFTVAGVTDVRLIEQMRDALARVVAEGGTQRDFERAVRALASDAGVEQLAGFHLETVFRTNALTAYSNGRFQQMRDPAVMGALPYWKYLTVGDGRVRENHAAMDGFVARAGDPVWGKWYPPAGFNCRCTVIAIGPEEAPADADLPGLERIPAQPDEGFGGLGGLV